MKSNSHIKVIQSRKYKDISLYLRFSMPASFLNKACSLLLSKMISEQCNAYPTKKEMSFKKDMLYGISLDSRSDYRAGVITQEINYSFIHPKFISIDIDEYVYFINETLYGCLIDETSLQEAKDIIISMIRRRDEVPYLFANKRVDEIISKENKDYQYKNYSDKVIRVIEKVSVDDLKKYYDFMLHKAQLYVYVSGDVDNEIVSKLTNLNFENRIVCKRNKYEKNSTTRKDVNKTMKGSQSTLVMVFKTPYDKYCDKFYAWKLGNAFLSVLPCSLLFEEVREKLSLCYSINAIESLDAGYVRIVTSIDAKNKKLVKDEVFKQIDRLIRKDVDPIKFEMAKKLFCSSIDSIKDNDNELIQYYYEASLSGKYTPFNEYKKRINDVTLDEISQIFKNYTYYFTYFLKGKE